MPRRQEVQENIILYYAVPFAHFAAAFDATQIPDYYNFLELSDNSLPWMILDLLIVWLQRILWARVGDLVYG